MPRLSFTRPRAVFAALFAFALAVPIVSVVAQDNLIPVPDFCLGQCGPLFLPDPPANPNYDCGGDCLTWLCACNTVGLRDPNTKKLIGAACNCDPNALLFKPLDAA